MPDLSAGMKPKSNLGSVMQYVPEFLRPTASGQSLQQGDPNMGSIAHVAPFGSKDTSNIYVDRPNDFAPTDLAHELVHQVQRTAGAQGTNIDTRGLLVQKDAAKQRAMYEKTYGSGGVGGAANLKSVASLNDEQQANLVSDYMKQYSGLAKSGTTGDLAGIDAVNAAYQRPMQQLANMARPGNTIDTTPAAPGPPPALLTGQAKPLSQIGAALPSVSMNKTPVLRVPFIMPGAEDAIAHTTRSGTMAVPNPKGLVEPGNLPIWNRPMVKNADGSHSSEYSTSFQDDNGHEVLVPTVVNGRFLTPDGKKPPEGSAAEKTMFKQAWKYYQKTGQHLGKFDNPDNADSYAGILHSRGSN